MIFDAHQRSSLHAPLPPRSKVFLWYAFACCQKQVKGVSKFVCDSSQRFAKDVTYRREKKIGTPDRRLPKTWSKIPVTQAKGLSKVLCAFRARVPCPRFTIVYRVPIFYAFPACYTGFLALNTKDAIYPYSCFMLDKFWRNLSALIRFFVLNYLQTLTEKRPERSLLIFEKIDVLNFISVLIFFRFCQE